MKIQKNINDKEYLRKLLKEYEMVKLKKKSIYNWTKQKTSTSTSGKPSKRNILNNYTPDEILDMLDDKDIELYLRNKKLKKITNKIR